MTRIPDHVVAHLVATGAIDPSGVGRHARPRTCRRCGALTIAGLDHDRAALVARIDPTPLNPAGEATALLAGRLTYTLHADKNAYRIDTRWLDQIRAHPAGQINNADVVAEHQCHAPPITGVTASRIPPQRHPQLADTCPF